MFIILVFSKKKGCSGNLSFLTNLLKEFFIEDGNLFPGKADDTVIVKLRKNPACIFTGGASQVA